MRKEQWGRLPANPRGTLTRVVLYDSEQKLQAQLFNRMDAQFLS